MYEFVHREKGDHKNIQINYNKMKTETGYMKSHNPDNVVNENVVYKEERSIAWNNPLI